MVSCQRSAQRPQQKLRTAVLALTIACGASAWAAPIRLSTGLVEGTVEGGLRVYRGIPYAAPPVGEWRWRAPQAAASWEGVRKADAFGPSCMQSTRSRLGVSGLEVDEDCLTINVWVPESAIESAEGLPVLVWIYGGGFAGGSSATPLYSGEKLASRGVVFVSFNYRVGPFGFFAHPELSVESENAVSGNYGLLDQIAALRWIQDNVRAFGGDPERVTIFGESAGGISVSILAASPLAKGLFHGAISQSGGSFGPTRTPSLPGENISRLADAEKAGARLGDKLGAPSLSNLRALPAEAILDGARGEAGIGWPTLDGHVIAGDQVELYKAGRYNDTPILIGINSDEGATFSRIGTVEEHVASVKERFGPFAGRILELYPANNEAEAKRAARDLVRDLAFGWHTWSWARLQAQAGGSNVYLYYFDQVLPVPDSSPFADARAFHAAELPYVFEHLDQRSLAWRPEDFAISEAMATYWTNFAKQLDPNGAGLPSWPRFTGEESQLLTFNGRPFAAPVPNPQQLEGLDDYFAWRRTPAGAHFFDEEGDRESGGRLGILNRRPVFGGACKICPWGAVAEIVRDAMTPYGYDVQVCYNCSTGEAPRLVAGAKQPPPIEATWRRAPQLKHQIPAPPAGAVDFGAVGIKFLWDAYRGVGAYAADGPYRNLRLLATIQSPTYLVVATRKELGVSDLAELKEKRWPLRVLMGFGAEATAVLEHYGLDRQTVEAAGGEFLFAFGREPTTDFDLLIGEAAFTTAPEFSFWNEVSQRVDLTYHDLPEELLKRLAEAGERQPVDLPNGFLRGVERRTPTVAISGIAVYGRDDMPESFAYDVAKALDERQDLLQWSHLPLSYNPHNVWQAFAVPLHRGAERYYREVGYQK